MITTVITLGVLLVLQPIEKYIDDPERRAEDNRARRLTRDLAALT